MLPQLRLAMLVMMGAAALTRPAEARVDIRVDLASQTMQVDSATGSYVWPISSARSGYRTPHGTFGVQRMEAMHYSHKYYNSPMPHSLFFAGGYAIHGTYETGALGRPASHGCIRIAPANAAALYRMVADEGARISIVGSAPGVTRYADRSRTRYARRVYGRYASRHLQRDDGYAGDGAYPNRALGYAPARAPDVFHWLDDPTGY